MDNRQIEHRPRKRGLVQRCKFRPSGRAIALAALVVAVLHAITSCADLFRELAH